LPDLSGIAANIVFVKQFKKMLRVAGMALLIALACFGICLAGGAPAPVYKTRENSIEIRTELKDADENKSDYILFENLE
jgi:hypothetical protein